MLLTERLLAVPIAIDEAAASVCLGVDGSVDEVVRMAHDCLDIVLTQCLRDRPLA